jgi:hypothetical protein
LLAFLDSGLTTDNAIYEIINLFNEHREMPAELDREELGN